MENLLASPIVTRLGWTLLHSLWEGAVLCALAWIALRLLRRASANARFAVAFVAMLQMLVLPVGTFLLLPAPAETRVMARAVENPGQASVQTPPRPPHAAARVLAPAAPMAQSDSAVDDDSAADPSVGVALPQASQSSGFLDKHRVESVLSYAVLLWLAGVLVLSLWRLGGWILLQRLRVVGASPVGAEIERAMRRIAKRLAISRKIRLLASTHMDVPVVLGFLKPVILFPPALLAGLSTQQLDAILAHELAHIRRHDYLALLLQTTIETLLFYHPGTWWLSRQIGLEREQCCDDIAAELSGDRRSYATALAAIETIRFNAPVLAATGTSASELMQRIARLIGVDLPARATRPQRLRTAGIAFLAVLALLCSMTFTAKGQADAAGTITITVKDDTGRPVAGALVRVRGESLNTSDHTDDNGSAKLQVGITPRTGFGIEVSADSYTSPRITWNTTTEQAAPPNKYDITLEKTVSIGGQVVDQDGNPLPNAKVMIEARKKYPNSTQALVSIESVTASRLGRWEYDKLPAQVDVIEIAATHPECLGQYGFFDLQPFKDIAALHAKTAQLKLTRGTPIEGIIKGPDGQVIANARVEFGNDRVASNVLPAFNASDDGTFILGVKPGEAVITIKARGFAPELQRITVDKEPVKMTFNLKQPQMITGTIVDPDGNPVPNARIFFDTWRNARTLGNNARTDASGQWRWNGAPADEMFVDIIAPGFAYSRRVKVKAGDENLVKLAMPTIFRGTVVDAATGEPIKGYTAKDGILYGDNPQISWGGAGHTNIRPGGKPGQFEITFDEQRYPAMVVRVEAPGYESIDSPRIPMDGKTTDFLFKLPKGAPIEGTLLGTDGKPLANAIIFLIEQSRQIQIDYGTRFIGDRDSSRATTNADGRFQFPPQKAKYRLIVLRDDGAIIAQRDDFEKTHTLALQKWARIEGEARLGTKPAPNAEIRSSTTAFQADRTDSNNAYNFATISNQTTAGADGKFTLEKIYPGEIEIYKTMPQSFSGPATWAKAVPGETLHLIIGGRGRPVTGTIGPLPDELKDAVAGVILSEIATPPQWSPPVEVMEMSAEDARAWRIKWEASPEGQQFNAALNAAYSNRLKYYQASVKSSAFRIEEVEAGHYGLIINWQKPGPRSGGMNYLAQSRTEITISELPGGGASEDPINAGEIIPLPLRKLAPGESLPDLPLTTLDGKPIRLTDYRGKLLLIVPWQTYSREYLPPSELNDLAAAHKNDLAILGITTDAPAAKKYAQARNVSFPTASSSIAYLPMQWFPFDKAVQCGLISSEGKVIAILKPEELKAAVEKALQK